MGVGLLHVQVGLLFVCVYCPLAVKGITDVLRPRRCACVSGFLKRLWGTIQWTLFAAATAAMFTVSLVGHSRPMMPIAINDIVVTRVFLPATRCRSLIWIMTLMPDYGRQCVRLMKWWIATSWSTRTACSEGWPAWAGAPRSSLRGAMMESHGRWAWPHGRFSIRWFKTRFCPFLYVLSFRFLHHQSACFVAGDWVYVQAGEPKRAPSCGHSAPAQAGLANVVRCPRDSYPSTVVHQPHVQTAARKTRW